MLGTRLTAILFAAALLVPHNLTAQEAQNTPVNIRVTDPSGTAVPQARVRIVPSPDPSAKLETDRKGVVATNLKPGGYALFVESPGFRTFLTHFDVGEGKEAQTIAVGLEIGAEGSPTVLPPAGKPTLTVLAYPYHAPTMFSSADLRSMPQTTVTFHNSHSNAEETYSGVRLADLLTKLGAPLGDELHGEALANYIVATGSDGYRAVLALGEVDPSFHPGEVLIAEKMNGKPLDEHSGPFKLVVTEDKRPARSVRNLTTIELKLAQ